MDSMDQLTGFLCSGGRKLMNVKFLPGTNPNLTRDQLCDAARGMLESIKQDMQHNPPKSGRIAKSVDEAFA